MISGDKRDIRLDILRILSTIAVVLLHTAKRAWYRIPVQSFEWGVMTVYDGITRWAVPVFVMISGALFLGRDTDIKRLYKHNVLRLSVSYAVWAVFYAWLWFMEGESIDYSVKLLIKGNYHLWFLPMMIGLYISIPVLKKISDDEKLSGYFLAVSFAVAFVIPQLIDVLSFFEEDYGSPVREFYDNFDLRLFAGYPFYFILGHKIYTGRLRFSRGLLAAGGIAGALITVVSTCMVSWYRNAQCDIFYDYLTVNVLLMSVWIFAVFTNSGVRMKLTRKTSEIIIAVSGSCFGVYLIHEAVLIVFEKNLGMNVLTFDPVLSVPALAAVSFAAALLISYMMRLIPLAKKYVI